MTFKYFKGFYNLFGYCWIQNTLQNSTPYLLWPVYPIGLLSSIPCRPTGNRTCWETISLEWENLSAIAELLKLNVVPFLSVPRRWHRLCQQARRVPVQLSSFPLILPSALSFPAAVPMKYVPGVCTYQGLLSPKSPTHWKRDDPCERMDPGILTAGRKASPGHSLPQFTTDLSSGPGWLRFSSLSTPDIKFKVPPSHYLCFRGIFFFYPCKFL